MLNNPKSIKIHFPTALGLLILLVGVGVGIFFIKTKPLGETGTDNSLTPTQVKITNVTDTGFSVSFVTNKAVTGSIKYGADINSLKQSGLDDRDQLSGEAGSFEIHHISIKNLTAQTKYFFKIESGGKQFDNQGKVFEITTGISLGSPPAADPIYGTILTTAGTPAEGVVVYVNVANGAPLSALAKTNGNWALSLSTARTADLASYLTYDTQATMVNILAQGGKQGTAPAITTTSNDSPVPDIALGKSHDFRNLAEAKPTATPTTIEKTATQSASKSGFGLDPIIAEATDSGDVGEVTLDNPSVDGEVINATMPAFIGTGPPGKVLAIEINSENTYTGSAKIDEDGNWEFTPPTGLTPGEHTVTISYINDAGEEQTIKRSFVIAAAGQSDVPAITATQSGSTENGRTEMPSTDSGVPHPGTGETTLLIVLAGIGLVIGGIKLKNIV